MRRFEEDIQTLTEDTSAMGKMVTDMIERSVLAICEGDTDMADTVIADFEKANTYDNEIEEMAIRILTLYQPTAMDTRTVATVLKCITYLERIAKYSRNIAIATKYLSDKPSYEPVELIRPMGEAAVRMVRLSTRCFEERTVEGLDKISEMDDYLDRTMREDLRAIIGFISENGASADVCTYYISVLKFLERVGDHACKMAEKITFMVTGQRATIS
ncbi:MAG: phosphate signaling complex protein PhoU [Candidatus Methanomethylophilaceae archaeon]|nr:phosphate signaling complex protein PhoU [Candidatus Methanomethylophilaceae archaeon]